MEGDEVTLADDMPFRLFVHLSQSLERPTEAMDDTGDDLADMNPLRHESGSDHLDLAPSHHEFDDESNLHTSKKQPSSLRKSQSMGALMEAEAITPVVPPYEPALRDSGMIVETGCFRRTNSRSSVKEGSPSKFSPQRRSSKGSLFAETCGPVLDEFSIPFTKALLQHASVDTTLDDLELEALVQCLVQMLTRRGLMSHFVPYLVQTEYHGELNTWRERTGLMLMHSVAADCPISFAYLARCSKSFLSQLAKACSVRQLAASITDLLVKLQKQMHTLPLLQTYILQCTYSETNKNAFGIAMIFFLRFLLPYLTHPRHAVHRPSIIAATKVLSFVAGSQVAEYEEWSEEYRTVSSTWRARIVSMEFFRGLMDRKVPIVSDTKELAAPRRSIDQVRSVILPYVRNALHKLDSSDLDVAKVVHAMGNEV